MELGGERLGAGQPLRRRVDEVALGAVEKSSAPICCRPPTGSRHSRAPPFCAPATNIRSRRRRPRHPSKPPRSAISPSRPSCIEKPSATALRWAACRSCSRRSRGCRRPAGRSGRLAASARRRRASRLPDDLGRQRRAGPSARFAAISSAIQSIASISRGCHSARISGCAGASASNASARGRSLRRIAIVLASSSLRAPCGPRCRARRRSDRHRPGRAPTGRASCAHRRRRDRP